jgi:hypothetical protein
VVPLSAYKDPTMTDVNSKLKVTSSWHKRLQPEGEKKLPNNKRPCQTSQKGDQKEQNKTDYTLR